MPELSVHRPLHAQLLYHVLAHLDLGADAASLYDPELPLRPWVPGLLKAYCAAPERLAVHGLPLQAPDLPALMAALEPGATAALADVAGQTLADRLAAAMDAERARVELRQGQTTQQAEACRVQAMELLNDALPRLRRALWSGACEVPRLRVLDCDALLRQGGTHGRATMVAGEQVVALSLAASPGQVLCQLLHEEVHSVTDPEVLRGHAGARDTRAGSDGFDLHRRLERAAVERGQQLVDDAESAFRQSYALWRERHGC